MAILYRTAKFNSRQYVCNSDWDSTAKFNSCQYFRLYDKLYAYYCVKSLGGELKLGVGNPSASPPLYMQHIICTHVVHIHVVSG